MQGTHIEPYLIKRIIGNSGRPGQAGGRSAVGGALPFVTDAAGDGSSGCVGALLNSFSDSPRPRAARAAFSLRRRSTRERSLHGRSRHATASPGMEQGSATDWSASGRAGGVAAPRAQRRL